MGVTRRVAYVATSDQSLRTFLRDTMWRLRDEGFDVHAVCSTGPVPPAALEADLGLPVHDLPLHRRIAPLADVRSVLALAWRLRRLRVDLVHAHTPKGGLVGMLAAWRAGMSVIRSAKPNATAEMPMTSGQGIENVVTPWFANSSVISWRARISAKTTPLSTPINAMNADSIRNVSPIILLL